MIEVPAFPGPGEGKRGEEGYLGYLLRQASNANRVRMDRALADLGITHPQFAVMTMLAAYPNCSNADLARVALLTPQSTNVIVRNLETIGAVTKGRHAVHGRIRPLVLTAAGRTLLSACRDRVQEVERTIASTLSARDEQVVRRWLAAISSAM